MWGISLILFHLFLHGNGGIEYALRPPSTAMAYCVHILVCFLYYFFRLFLGTCRYLSPGDGVFLGHYNMDFREWGEGRISRRQQSIKRGDHRKLTTANVGGITKITQSFIGGFGRWINISIWATAHLPLH